MSDTTEIYLRTVLELEDEGLVPLRARVAGRLGHSVPAASQTVARMQRDGLLTVSADRRIRLTPAGRSAATRVMRKHRLAECLLVDLIGLDCQLAQEEACRWEHVMSDAVERRLLHVLGYPTQSPYGNPIPGLAELAKDSGCENLCVPERLEVQRAVAASAGEIFAVLTDPNGHVAIDSSGMLMGASGDMVAGVGDTFLVHMDREALNDYPLGLYDVTVEIVTFEPDQEIAWTVHGQLDLGHVYGYRLEPIAGGTLVTSYYDWSAAEQSWKDAAIFPVIPESALRATLGILARTVAPGKPRPEFSASDLHP